MAQVVVEQDVRLKTGAIEIPPPDGPIQAYFAKPKNSGKRPAVIVIHENRGLNPVDVSFFYTFLGYTNICYLCLLMILHLDIYS